MQADAHRPVLLEEVLAGLDIRDAGVYVDATYGRGGHASALLARLGPRGRLYAIDRDPTAVADASARLRADTRFTIQQGRFSMLGQFTGHWGVAGQVDGILLDLGVSSPQLDTPARGFSFRHAGPLDMRMDPSSGESAADWINRADETEIADVLFKLGEERFARRIARAIVRARVEAPITTTDRLAALIAEAVPTRERGKDPATRSFQAIRLHINRELDELAAALPQAVAALAPRGRLAVISFHSLEDRMVKQFLRAEVGQDPYPPDLPVRHVAIHGRLRLLGKARPGAEEVARNPRARSAVLRLAERTEVAHA